MSTFDAARLAELEHDLQYADPTRAPLDEVSALIAAYRELAGYRPPDGFVAQTADGRRGTWMQTFVGGRFYPLDPRAEEVEIADIAHGLAMTCRYGGHARRFYSVAEHAVIVSMYVPPEYAREALLHDSSEAYIGDMIRPLKHTPEMLEFRRAEEKIERVVFDRFGIHQTDASRAAVKEIDDRVLVDEIGALMADPPMYWERHHAVKPLGANIAALPPAQAEHVFTMRFLELFPEWRP